jgi:hypothetical protein
MANKTPYTIADQITLLKQRGMLFNDEQSAHHFLENISYYRLKGYWWDMQDDVTTHTFKPNTYFEDIIDRYYFDRRLRLILFDAIERIEIALRTKMIYHLSISYGSLWYLDSNLFEATTLPGRMVNSNNAFNEVNFIMNNLDNINSKEWNTLTNNANIRIDNNSNMYFEDTRIFTSEVSNLKDGAAFTLPGIGIFVNPKDIGNLDLLRHEYGHILEYNRYGAADYLVIIISSMYSANYAYPHQKTWTESQANTLSYYYFNQPSNWNMNIYPIDKNYLKTIKK